MKLPRWRRGQDSERDEEIESHLRLAIADSLPVDVSALVAAQVRTAGMWWRDNRPKAPGAIRTELERASSLIAFQPEIGARARNIAPPGVRRLHPARIPLRSLLPPRRG